MAASTRSSISKARDRLSVNTAWDRISSMIIGSRDDARREAAGLMTPDESRERYQATLNALRAELTRLVDEAVAAS